MKTLQCACIVVLDLLEAKSVRLCEEVMNTMPGVLDRGNHSVRTRLKVTDGKLTNLCYAQHFLHYSEYIHMYVGT